MTEQPTVRSSAPAGEPAQDADAEVGLAWDRSGGAHNGRVYLVYTDETPDESNNLDILVRFSGDNGATWSAPVRVNDDAGTNSQFLPRIALDQTTGNIAVSWYDARNDTGSGPGSTDGTANDDAQFFSTVSTDGGLTFLPNVKVSAGVSSALVSAVSGTGFAHHASGSAYDYVTSVQPNVSIDAAKFARPAPAR